MDWISWTVIGAIGCNLVAVAFNQITMNRHDDRIEVLEADRDVWARDREVLAEAVGTLQGKVAGLSRIVRTNAGFTVPAEAELPEAEAYTMADRLPECALTCDCDVHGETVPENDGDSH